MKEKGEKKEYFWKVLAVVVIAAFALQSLITYHAITKDKKSSEKEAPNLGYENVQLKPRQKNAPENNQVQLQKAKRTSIAPKPLPNLSVNFQNLPGIKPSAKNQQNNPIHQNQLMPRGMNINIHNNPFGMNMREEMAKMEALMNQMMSRHGMNTSMRMPSSRIGSMNMGGVDSPSITVDSDNNYVVTLKIPGLSKSEVKAKINGNMLTVSGVQKSETSSNSQGANSYATSYRSFHNSFLLPGPTKTEEMKLDYKEDILTVKVPKA